MISVYISGPYTAKSAEGIEMNVKNARRAAAHHMAMGRAVFCPHTMFHEIDIWNDFEWNDYMVQCLYWLKHCDEIHLLSGWSRSKGAKIEHMMAKALGLKIDYPENEGVVEDG